MFVHFQSMLYKGCCCKMDAREGTTMQAGAGSYVQEVIVPPVYGVVLVAWGRDGML